jgi:LysM repeat protein
VIIFPPSPTADDPGIDPVTQTIFVGQVIRIPNPGYLLPTATPLPSNIAPGTEVSYSIRPGDTLEAIASKFNSTVEDIKKINDIVEDNSIQAGQIIKVRVNLVTPTPARAPTITQGPSPTPPSPFTNTPVGGAAAVIPTVTLTLTLTPTP